VLHPFRDIEKLTLPQRNGFNLAFSIFVLHGEFALKHKKEFVFIQVVVPDKLTLKLDQLQMLPIQFCNDFWGPVLGKLTQFFRKINFGHNGLHLNLRTSMRLRSTNDRLKIEHAIVDGVRRMLGRLLEDNPEIRSIVPGRIAQVRDAKGKVSVRITVPTMNGFKAIALSDGARQELFISTSLSKEQLEAALQRAAERANE
jgi:hypothetical protein